MTDPPEEQESGSEQAPEPFLETDRRPQQRTLFDSLHPWTILLLALSCLTLNQLAGELLWNGRPGVGVLGLAAAPLVGIALPLVLILRHIELPVLSELGLVRISLRQVVATFACIVGTLPIVYLLSGVNARFYEPSQEYFEIFRSFAPDGPLSLIAGFLAIVVAVPLGEELIFRRLVQGVFLRSMSPQVAVILSGLVFGAAHLSPWILLPISFLGIVLAVLALRTGTLTAAWLGHAAFNFFSYAELAMTSDPTSTRMEQLALRPGSVILGVVLLAAGLLLISREETATSIANR